jgi:hypothetical protein
MASVVLLMRRFLEKEKLALIRRLLRLWVFVFQRTLALSLTEQPLLLLATWTVSVEFVPTLKYSEHCSLHPHLVSLISEEIPSTGPRYMLESAQTLHSDEHEVRPHHEARCTSEEKRLQRLSRVRPGRCPKQTQGLQCSWTVVLNATISRAALLVARCHLMTQAQARKK